MGLKLNARYSAILLVGLSTGALFACFDDGAVHHQDEAIAVAQQATVETWKSLGPHTTRAVTLTKQWLADGPTQESDLTVEIRWQDDETFAWRRVRDGKIRQEIVLAEGAGWKRTGKRPFQLVNSPDAYLRSLSENWSVWGEAIGPFLGRATVSQDGEGIVEGRPAWKYQLSLTPLDQEPVATRTALKSLSGSLWVDKATAIRLAADIRGSWTTFGRQPLHHEMSFKLERTAFGEHQGVAPPFTSGDEPTK